MSSKILAATVKLVDYFIGIIIESIGSIPFVKHQVLGIEFF
ncbi:MAG: hypothetical protein QXF82_05685 [Nitrososphaeria archaeon]